MSIRIFDLKSIIYSFSKLKREIKKTFHMHYCIVTELYTMIYANCKYVVNTADL